MKINDWEIKIFDGADPFTQIGSITPADRTTRAGLKFSTDPHGSCLVASWMGRNKELAAGRWIQHQDIIEIWVQETPGDPFAAWWSGFLIVVPNPYSAVAQQFQAYGLKQKLKNHHRAETWAESSASTMAYNVLLTIGLALGINVDSSNFSGGGTIVEVHQNYQSDWDLLEQISAGGGTVWGVDAVRNAFGREASTSSMAVTEGAPGTTVSWEPATGVGYCSRVTFVWPSGPDPDDISSYTVINSALEATHGYAEKLLWLPDPYGELVIETDYTPSPSSGTEAQLYDLADSGAEWSLSAAQSITMTATEDVYRVYVRGELRRSPFGNVQADLYIDGTFHDSFIPSGNGNSGWFSDSWDFTTPIPAGTHIDIYCHGGGVGLGYFLNLQEFHAERAGSALSGLATPYWELVTDTPASAVAQGLLVAAPVLEITRPDSTVVDIPVAEVEYEISKQKNGTTRIKAGERISPSEQILQSLIKERDQDAQNNAVRIAKTGGA